MITPYFRALVMGLCLYSFSLSILASDEDAQAQFDDDEEYSLQRRFVPEGGLVEFVIVAEGVETLCQFVCDTGICVYSAGAAVCSSLVSCIGNWCRETDANKDN